MSRCALLLAILVLGWSQSAQAQYCGAATNGNIDFGHVNSTANTNVIGQIRIWCNGASTPYVRVCISLGAPLAASYDPRYMNGPPGYTMMYNIYSDASYTQIWGAGMTAQSPQVAVDMTMESWGGADTTVPYYARVPPQTGLPTGNYWVNYNAPDTAVRVFGYNTTPPACDTAWPIVATFNFGVVAQVDATCALTAGPLSFGSTGNLASAIQAAGSVSVNCPPNLAYTIALNAGQGSGATVAERKMTRVSGSETLSYRLYSDAARTMLWGDGSNGTSTVADMGSGSVQTRTVYGTLPAQSVTATGEYRDIVTVTVTY